LKKKNTYQICAIDREALLVLFVVFVRGINEHVASEVTVSHVLLRGISGDTTACDRRYLERFSLIGRDVKAVNSMDTFSGAKGF
jgi:hypothetical protein